MRRPGDDDDDGPFPSSIFPNSVFPRRIFPWMGGDDEEDEKPVDPSKPDQRKTDAEKNRR